MNSSHIKVFAERINSSAATFISVFVLALATFSPGVVLASTTAPIAASYPCDNTSAQPFLTLTKNISGDADSGARENWATDSFTENIKVWVGSDGSSYCALANTTNGTFVTTGPNSPQAGIALAAGITGTFVGGETYTFASTTPLTLASGYSTSTPTTAVLPAITTPGSGEFSNWVSEVFTNATGSYVDNYALTYVTPNNGTWTDADPASNPPNGTAGDITGSSPSVTVSSEADLVAALANTAVTNITFANDITVTAALIVNHTVTIDGAGHKLLATFAETSSSNNAAMIIESDSGVVVKNLIEDGTGSTNLHGINAYDATNVLLDGVTVSNNAHSGLNVDGSTVTVNNITTSGNGWDGIDVDSPTLTATTTLTITGTSVQTETSPDIVKDDNSKTNVSVVDSNSQYTSATYTHDTNITGTIYTLKLPLVYVDSVNGSDSNSGSQAAPLKTLQAAVNAVANSGTVTLLSDATTTSEIIVSKALTIDGGGHTLFAPINNSVNSNLNNAGLGIVSDTGAVTIKNLTIDGSGSNHIHDINIFDANNVTLDYVTVQNATKAGITVNGGNVTVNSVTTKDNSWGGINADLAADATISSTVLTVTGTMSQTETGPDIWKDDNTKPVSVVASNNQYTSATYQSGVGITGTIYTLISKVTATNTAIVVNNPSQELDVTVNSGTTNATINVSALITAGSGTLPAISVTNSTVDVSIPASTVVTSTDTAWNGVINLPTATTTYVTPPTTLGFNSPSVTSAIEIGAGDTPLTFNNPVKLTFAGKANSLIGWSQAGVFHPITATCDSATNPTLAAGADCSINVGSDLVVWTKHFSTFISYTQTASQAVGGGVSGGGGGGGGFSSIARAATPSVTAPVVGQGQVLGASAYNFGSEMSQGAKNSTDVDQLQTILIADGYLSISAPTGYFGPLTKAAVMKYQSDRHIPSTGYVGPLTLAALNAGTTPTVAQENASMSTIAALKAKLAVLEAELAQMLAASSTAATTTASTTAQ